MRHHLNAPQPCQEEGEMNQTMEIFNDTSMTHINTDVKPASPLRSIRKHCLWCCNDSSHEATLCPAKNCPSHALKFGKRPKGIASVRPLKVIRAQCLDCSGFSPGEISACNINNCPLWKYRSGHNPKLAGRRPSNGHSFKKFVQPESVLACENNCAVQSMGG